MAMFHIRYPKKRAFFSWDELGCLARSLGFQMDLFKQNITEEISVEEDGIFLKEILLMLEYGLLYKALHQTINLHTAEWNMAAMRKALLYLDHRALSFAEINSIRVSYQLYEAGDMKGMKLDKHTLIRSLKMCGRMIAPLKLMHRIKHMKGDFEEKGRIQLYEYMDLILWCDLYASFDPSDMKYPEGMENMMFKLVDFERLLSHHDERLANTLNRQYLQEEWDFGRETLESDKGFADPPVRNEVRIKQTKYHKQRYRFLKSEVGQSQTRVYRAHAGFIRERPITAPNLTMYHQKAAQKKRRETTAGDAYNTVQKRLKSAPSSSRTRSGIDRPQTHEYQRQETPKAVTQSELKEITKKIDSLKFDMLTMESKYDLDKEEKMDIYLPGYREKLAKRPPPVPPPEPEPDPPKQMHWTEKIIEQLVHPKIRLLPSHGRKCDARFRGWHEVRTRKGPHHILVANSYESSSQGKMYNKMKDWMFEPVKHLHRDHLYRYTSAVQVEKGKGRLSVDRPFTAPPQMMGTVEVESTVSESSQEVIEQSDILKVTQGDTETHGASPDEGCRNEQVEKVDKRKEEPDRSSVPDKNIFKCDNVPSEPSLEYESSVKDLQARKRQMAPPERESSASSGSTKPAAIDPAEDDDCDIPVPQMDHSQPRVVEVGQIGRIELLEKINESQDLEERYSLSSRKSERQSCQESEKSKSVKADDASSKSTGNRQSDAPRPKSGASDKLFNKSIPTPVPALSLKDQKRENMSQVHSECQFHTVQSHIGSLSQNSMNNDPVQKIQDSARKEEELSSSGDRSSRRCNRRVEIIKDPESDDTLILNSPPRRRSSTYISRYSIGGPRNSTFMTVDVNQLRLVRRLGPSISADLKLRLLAYGQC